MKVTYKTERPIDRRYPRRGEFFVIHGESQTRPSLYLAVDIENMTETTTIRSVEFSSGTIPHPVMIKTHCYDAAQCQIIARDRVTFGDISVDLRPPRDISGDHQ